MSDEADKKYHWINEKKGPHGPMRFLCYDRFDLWDSTKASISLMV